jgi:hypothetical protein
MMKKIVAVSAVVASTFTASTASAEGTGGNWLMAELAQCSHYAYVAVTLNASGVENSLYDNYIERVGVEVLDGGLLSTEERNDYTSGFHSLKKEAESPDFNLQPYAMMAILKAMDCDEFLDAFIVIRQAQGQ